MGVQLYNKFLHSKFESLSCHLGEVLDCLFLVYKKITGCCLNLLSVAIYFQLRKGYTMKPFIECR
jgi:hypothetical protein